MDIKKLLPQISEIAQEAGQILLKIQPKARQTKKKSFGDFVTNADLRANSLITKRLKKLTPKIPIYSEEAKRQRNKNQSIWIIDPLDGTVNFFHQDILWGTTIALIEDNKVQLGAIFLPALSWLVAATRNGEVITKGKINFGVTKDNKLSETQIRSEWTKKSRKLPLDIFSKLTKVNKPQIRGCASAGYLAVALGQISAYVLPYAPIEDMAAGSLIVEKAGGKITDIKGKDWTPSSNSIVASNGLLHKKILKLIN